jgi:hypothetical protein
MGKFVVCDETYMRKNKIKQEISIIEGKKALVTNLKENSNSFEKNRGKKSVKLAGKKQY